MVTLDQALQVLFPAADPPAQATPPAIIPAHTTHHPQRGSMGRRRGKRNRERRDRRIVHRAEWCHAGQVEIRVEITRRGVLWLTVLDARRLGSVAREVAADWLKEYLPRLTHDQRFGLLFEGV